ncbi:MAG: hypothetical protein AAGE52_20915 [Myxococcota bacterium]
MRCRLLCSLLAFSLGWTHLASAQPEPTLELRQPPPIWPSAIGLVGALSLTTLGIVGRVRPSEPDPEED